MHTHVTYLYVHMSMHQYKCTQHLQTRETFVSNLKGKGQNGRHAKLPTTRHACTYPHMYLNLSVYVYMQIYLYVYMQYLQTREIIIPKTCI